MAQANVRRPFALFAWGVFGLGSVLLTYSVVTYPPVLTARLLILCVATVVAENFALQMPGYGVSLTYPLLVALALTCGPTGALLGAVLCGITYQEIKERLPRTVYAFNLGQLLLSNGLAAWAYVALGGRVLTTPTGAAGQITASDFPKLLLPIVALAVIGAFGNYMLIAVGYSLRKGVPVAEGVQAVGWLPPVQVALVPVGILLAQVLAANTFALPLFVFPLFVARQFYQRFMDLQDAYTQTLRSLVTGLEAKDPYTRGHSERVAEYAVTLADAMHLGDKDVKEVETMALLHDLGKLSIGGDVLRKQGALNEQEWETMKRHPEVGAAMVKRIPHLRELSQGVAAHHERLDGSGYPLGLAGPDICMSARILAIADSYDAMTTDRSYRKGLSHSEAIAELRVCSGKLYDPLLVELFINAMDSKMSNLSAGDSRQEACSYGVDSC